MGADPEFVLYDVENMRLTQAGNYPFFNKVGRDEKIGRDGNAYPVEIRPDPVPINNIQPMIFEIREMMKTIADYCNRKNLTIYGGAAPFDIPIGGHIHFGGRSVNLTRRFDVNDDFNKARKKISEIVDVLDNHLMPTLISMCDFSEAYRRLGHDYGRLGEWRNQPYGFEYRTPYCFLVSPFMTEGVYNLASLCFCHYKKLRNNSFLKQSMKDVYKKIRRDEEHMAFNILCKIKEKVKNRIIKVMGYYSPNPEYNQATLSLFNLVKYHKIADTCVLTNYGFQNQKYKKYNRFRVYTYDSSLQNIVENIEARIGDCADYENLSLFIYEYYPCEEGIDDDHCAIQVPEWAPYVGNNFPAEAYVQCYDDEFDTPYSIGINRKYAHEITHSPRAFVKFLDYIDRLLYEGVEYL